MEDYKNIEKACEELGFFFIKNNIMVGVFKKFSAESFLIFLTNDPSRDITIGNNFNLLDENEKEALLTALVKDLENHKGVEISGEEKRV